MRNTFEQKFHEAFERFDETAMISELHEKIKPRSYYARNKGWRTFLEGLSWLMNAISVLAAGYFIYSSTSLLTGAQWIGVLAGFSIIGALEIIKRKSSHEFWQIWFFKRRIAKGWLILSLVLFALSLIASAMGTKKGGEELAPDVELLKADSTLQAYKVDIAKMDAEVEDLRSNKNEEGITFYNLNDAISAKVASTESLRAEKLRLEKKLEGKNDLLTEDYQEEVEETTWVLVFIVIGCELIFEGCVAYIWFFYFRSMVENGLSEGWLQQVSDIYKLDVNPYPTESREHAPSKREHSSKEREHGRESGKNRSHSNSAAVLNMSREAREHVLPEREHEMAKREHEANHVTDDRYTVEHTYKKDGKDITVRYAQSTIESRVKQYSERLREAEQNEAHSKVIDNLTERLEYWIGKQFELMDKLEGLEVA